MSNFIPGQPLLQQLNQRGFELDQMLFRALEVSASTPNISSEDQGFPDSYLTLALYRLNTTLTRMATLDQSRYNLFHEYKLAPQCSPNDVIIGTRLAGIFDLASKLAAPGKTIGVGHYLRAIAKVSLDNPAYPADGFPGQVLHHTFSIETLLWGLGYTAWTPLSSAPEVIDLLQSLDGREPIEDVQYFMSIENDRLVIRATSILAPYTIRDHNRIFNNLGVLTHFKEQYAAILPIELLELEDLINSPVTKENDLQRFFENHPQFFRMWDYRNVYPHVYLTREEEGPLIPDFILINPDLQRATILDLKLPNAKIITHKTNRDRFTAAIDEARVQLLEYKDWFENKDNRRRLKEYLGMEIFRPRLGVIIGGNTGFRDAVERQKLTSRYPDIDVVTYDDVVKYAHDRLMLIKSATR